MSDLTRQDIAGMEWFTCRELANRWKVDPSTIHRWISEGTLPAMRLGSTYRVHKSVIEELERTAKHKENVAAVKRLRKHRHEVLDRIGSLD